METYGLKWISTVEEMLNSICNESDKAGFPFITVATGGLHSLYVQTHNEEELRAIKKCLDELGLLDENCKLKQVPTASRYRGMSK